MYLKVGFIPSPNGSPLTFGGAYSALLSVPSSQFYLFRLWS